ncbi:MAG: adenylate/guanylate cyclase domain-containing protein [Ignavibacteria bacterium]|nr:adenylate/guanylate cyclase domain-containing protein [Ignavibacteria bacterium]
MKQGLSSKLRTVFGAAIVGAVIGPLFTCIAFGFDIERAVKGLIAGVMISFLSAFFEKFVLETKFKKRNFSLVLAVRTLVYITVISFSVMFVWVVHESMLNSRGIIATIQHEDFSNFLTHVFPYIFLFAMAISFMTNLVIQVNGLLGKGVLLSYITGRYHKPKMEERFFMFLDLESSTTIAETIGPVKYHEFMSSFFFDISQPVELSKGEIYQYVGDEIVISWKKQNAAGGSACLRCFFGIKERIDSLSERYIKQFGLIPGFKAGVHYGEVVIGEVGDLRKEIVFHGDVMNTASRIQGQSKVLNKPLLISEEALKHLNLDDDMTSEPLGSFRLKGKEVDIKIFEITRSKK